MPEPQALKTIQLKIAVPPNQLVPDRATLGLHLPHQDVVKFCNPAGVIECRPESDTD